eukprot:CAMPEP_0203857596 /NCGR_PEP_ID=MMETSP0359-20131031/10816_1 /ASSEMBLY_ACC=CAM_ASM_000338 /TAXON_ID=268821 /ORGANISM="Scrippsiella Hangoei, Strain SHTV-5" /LENGTH=190 /DNA_ID=CAMNT_0050774311 /DNA_START=17 /DNA_END=589 /DNA_ORIENTATION=-
MVERSSGSSRSPRASASVLFVMLGCALWNLAGPDFFSLGFIGTGPLRAAVAAPQSASRGLSLTRRAAEAAGAESSAVAREYFLKLGWKNVKPDDEDEYVSRFRVISVGIGDYEAALQMVTDVPIVMYFGEAHLEASIAALKEKLGSARALEVIKNHPSCLTITAADVEINYNQIAMLADGFAMFKGFGLR